MLIDFNISYVSECLLFNITWRICRCCTKVGLFLFYSKTIADEFVSLEAVTSSTVHKLLRMESECVSCLCYSSAS